MSITAYTLYPAGSWPLWWNPFHAYTILSASLPILDLRQCGI